MRTWRLLYAACRAVYAAADARVPFGALCIKQGWGEVQRVGGENTRLIFLKNKTVVFKLKYLLKGI